MKKLLTLLAVAALPLMGRAQAGFDAYSFLNGWGVIVSNNITVSYGNTNISYIDLSTNLVSSLTNTYYPAITSGGIGFTNQTAIGMPWWTNTFSTNAAISAVLAAWKDVPTWADRNGNTPTDVSIGISGVGFSAGSTNVLTFLFAKENYSGLMVGPGGPPRTPPVTLLSPESITANRLSVPVTFTGTTPVTLVTNLSAQFFGGSGAIRLISIVSDNQTGAASCWVNAVVLQGFSP